MDQETRERQLEQLAGAREQVLGMQETLNQRTGGVIPMSSLEDDTTIPEIPRTREELGQETRRTIQEVPPTERVESRPLSLEEEVRATMDRDVSGELQTVREDVQLREKEERARTLNNRIIERDREFQRQVEQIERNEEGLTNAGVIGRINRLRREQSREMADLSFSYQVAQGDFQAAQNIVSERERNIRQEQQDRMQAFQILFNFAQNDMTESEKMQAQQEFQREQTRVSMENQMELERYRTQLEQESPLYSQRLRAQMLQNEILEMELMVDGTEITETDLSFAREYADTGKMPSGVPDRKRSVIENLALQIPKNPGQVVSSTTGVTPRNITPSQAQDYGTNLNLIESVNELIGLAMDIPRTAPGRVLTRATPSGRERIREYQNRRNEILRELRRRDYGARPSEWTIAEIEARLPSVGGMEREGFFSWIPATGEFGAVSNRKAIEKLEETQRFMESTLNSQLSSQGLSMYGFTQVNTEQGTFTVGDIVATNEGRRFIVNVDGSYSELPN